MYRIYWAGSTRTYFTGLVECPWHPSSGMAQPFYTHESAESFSRKIAGVAFTDLGVEYFDIGNCD